MRQRDELTRLGLYGLAPFVFGAAIMWISPLIVPEWIALNIQSLVLAYGGVTAAFLAGAGAGAGLRSLHQPAPAPVAIAVLACWFVIWPAGFLTWSAPLVWRYLALIAVFVWLLLRDLKAAENFPSWYAPLRIRLTFWTCVSLVLIMARLISWRQF